MNESYAIVTSADEGYAHFVRNLAQNCLQMFGQKLIVYDLGICEDTKKTIDAHFIEFKTSEEYKNINSKNSIRATHKPRCILDYFYRSQQKFLFIDADCLFTERPVFPEADICLTFRIYSEQTANDFRKNGIINSGVILIDPLSKNKADLESLLKSWISRCEDDQDSTDQKALSDILLSLKDIISPGKRYRFENAEILILESEFFNDVKRRTGSILHFKAASRRAEKMQEYLLFYKLTKFNALIKAFIYANRILLGIKRKRNPERYKTRFLKEML